MLVVTACHKVTCSRNHVSKHASTLISTRVREKRATYAQPQRMYVYVCVQRERARARERERERERNTNTHALSSSFSSSSSSSSSPSSLPLRCRTSETYAQRQFLAGADAGVVQGVGHVLQRIFSKVSVLVNLLQKGI